MKRDIAYLAVWMSTTLCNRIEFCGSNFVKFIITGGKLEAFFSLARRRRYFNWASNLQLVRWFTDTKSSRNFFSNANNWSKIWIFSAFLPSHLIFDSRIRDEFLNRLYKYANCFHFSSELKFTCVHFTHTHNFFSMNRLPFLIFLRAERSSLQSQFR